MFYKKKAENAEQRALDYYRILQNIEDTILKAEIDKTPAVLVVDKIKNELVRPLNQN